MKPLRRGNTYYLNAKVPTRYHPVEPRRLLQISLKTDSYELAKIKLPQVWGELVTGWELRLAGRDEDAHKRFDAAGEIAGRAGYTYLPQNAVVALPARELVNRVKAISVSPDGNPDKTEAAALLGSVPKPRISLDDALEIYMKSKRIDHAKKSEQQIKDVRARKENAISRFKNAMGDMSIEDITRHDLFAYRNWWAEYIEENGINPGTATKSISELSSMLKEVFRVKLVNLDLNLSGLAFKSKSKPRPPFSDEWIKNKIMANGALDGLNKDARCILLGMVNTGFRPVEGANLITPRIRLDTDIPHIIVADDNRELKTAHSERIIPLTGISLEAMRECPDGFPEYANDKGSLSVILNQYMSRNGLRETDDHSVYSLRHSFFDRVMNNPNIKEEFCRTLMGHTKNGMSYGKGAALVQLHKDMQDIAL